MKIKTLLIIAGVIVILVIAYEIFSNSSGTINLCIVNASQPFTKVGTCEYDSDCPPYASVCELGARKCMAPNYITEKNVTYAPSAKSKEECLAIGGSWKAVGKDKLYAR